MNLIAFFFFIVLFFGLFLVLSVVGAIRRMLGMRPSRRREREQSAETDTEARQYLNRRIDKERAEDAEYEEIKD